MNTGNSIFKRMLLETMKINQLNHSLVIYVINYLQARIMLINTRKEPMMMQGKFVGIFILYLFMFC